jgi:hypothetical protein
MSVEQIAIGLILDPACYALPGSWQDGQFRKDSQLPDSRRCFTGLRSMPFKLRRLGMVKSGPMKLQAISCGRAPSFR